MNFENYVSVVHRAYQSMDTLVPKLGDEDQVRHVRQMFRDQKVIEPEDRPAFHINKEIYEAWTVVRWCDASNQRMLMTLADVLAPTFTTQEIRAVLRYHRDHPVPNSPTGLETLRKKWLVHLLRRASR